MKQMYRETYVEGNGKDVDVWQWYWRKKIIKLSKVIEIKIVKIMIIFYTYIIVNMLSRYSVWIVLNKYFSDEWDSYTGLLSSPLP